MTSPHIMIIEARFYEDISDELAKGAISALEDAGATYKRYAVPGALEIPAAIAFAVEAMHLSPRQHYDGFIALGCVIRGETTHYDIVAEQSAAALQKLSIQYSLPIGNGILTVENDDQAWARARVNDKNKGGDAARACLAMVQLKRQLIGQGL